MDYYPISIYNTFQQSWDEINNQIGSKCSESGFYLIVDLIALLLKTAIMYVIDHYHVIATIAIQLFIHYFYLFFIYLTSPCPFFWGCKPDVFNV